MATLLLTAVGTAVGGPIGGAIGALVGQQVDGAVFGNGSNEGPRISDLSVTRSTYGQAIPRIFGSMRVPGTIIWATDLQETNETASNGKGKPKTTTYSYSMSFAVAISSCPIAEIGRIWADGNLLRGAAGDLKTPGSIRFYNGHGEQKPDPLIASAIGAECPGFRNTAYAVFENLQLGDFGNRIPTLTFEVLADPDAEISLGSLVPFAVQSDAAIPELRGFSDRGGPIVQMLQSLNRVMPIVCHVSDQGLALSFARDADDAPPIELTNALALGGPDSHSGHNERKRQRSTATLPEPRALRYFDIERDYQTGVQRTFGVASTGQEVMLELPAAMNASAARMVCNQQTLAARWQRDKLNWQVPELGGELTPGIPVELPGFPGKWMIQNWEWMDRGVALELERIAPFLTSSSQTSAGAVNSPIDAPTSATELALIELPWDGTGSSAEHSLFAAASGTGEAWRGATLFVNQAGSLIPITSQIESRATIGVLASSLPPSPSLSLERLASVEIQFTQSERNLLSTTIAGLASGANRIAVGGEVLQFLCAEPLSDTQWKLSGLLRGRGGTEGAAATGHSAGSQVVLIDASLVGLDTNEIPPTDYTEIAAIGLADAEPVYASTQITGLSRNPLPPVHASRTENVDGAWTLCWTRRARGQWQWASSVDLPLVEEAETYRIGVGSTEQPAVSWQVDTAQLTINSSDVAILLNEHSGAQMWVKQIGSFGVSQATKITTIP